MTLFDNAELTARRTTGSYSFGYEEMNEILRNAHQERRKRLDEATADVAQIQRLAVVCFPYVLTDSRRNVSTSEGTKSSTN